VAVTKLELKELGILSRPYFYCSCTDFFGSPAVVFKLRSQYKALLKGWLFEGMDWLTGKY
jgi:hypothetical protein